MAALVHRRRVSNPSASSLRANVPKMGCGYAVCVVLGIIGTALLFAADSKWRQGQRIDAWILGMLAAGSCLAAIGLIAPMRREVARAKERRRLEEAKPGEPWTWEPAWTGNKGIVQSGRRHGRTLIFAGVAVIVISLPALLALPRELARGNHAVWIALAFPLVGTVILAGAAKDAWRRRKYGTARFVAPALPVPLATELAGMVIVDRSVVPLGAGRVSLECWCTTGTRHSDKRDEVVAHTEREIAPAEWTTSAGESRLFVQVPIRGGAATTMVTLAADSPVYEWRLRVQAPTAGADFAAEFVLPVFEIAGASGVVKSDAGLAPARVVDRGDVWRSAGIVEEPQAGANGGMALVLPAGLGRPLVGAPLTMALVFGVLAAVLWWSPVPGIIASFFGLFALLPAMILKSLWSGGGERVWLEPDDICVQRGTRPLRRIATREVQSIEPKKNVGVGTQQFYRVVARCRPAREGRFPRRVEIVSMVRGDEAAGEVIAWLQERMTNARA